MAAGGSWHEIPAGQVVPDRCEWRRQHRDDLGMDLVRSAELDFGFRHLTGFPVLGSAVAAGPAARQTPEMLPPVTSGKGGKAAMFPSPYRLRKPSPCIQYQRLPRQESDVPV
jgi:hypothetical protein